ELVFSQLPKQAPGLVRPLVRAISQKTQETFIAPQLQTHFAFWESELALTGWFAGEAFSAADVMMSFPVEAATSRGLDRSRFKNLADFLERIHARPAYVRALERGGPYSYA